ILFPHGHPVKRPSAFTLPPLMDALYGAQSALVATSERSTPPGTLRAKKEECHDQESGRRLPGPFRKGKKSRRSFQNKKTSRKVAPPGGVFQTPERRLGMPKKGLGQPCAELRPPAWKLTLTQKRKSRS